MAERGQSSSLEGGASSRLEVVGRILGVHGVKGWVKVYSNTDPMDNLQQYQPWHLKQVGPGSGSEWKPVKVTGFRPQGKGLIAQLEGIADRDAAAALVGQEIGVPADFDGARWQLLSDRRERGELCLIVRFYGAGSGAEVQRYR